MSKVEIKGLNRRWVCITGCDSGFGNLLAKNLDSKGVNVIAGCLTEKGATDLRSQTSSRVKTIIVDITDKESVARAFESTKKYVGDDGLWGLVNNAGVMPNFAPAEWTTLDEYEAACKVNLFGTISMTLAFLPLLRQSRGRLVNVCSVVSSCGYPGISNYVISKAGVKMFTACLRRELMGSGVTAHSIEPGGFKTHITDKNRILNVWKKAYWSASQETRDFYGGNISNYVIDGIKVSERYVKGNPQDVADVMTHALLAKYPKMRYLVGPDAKVFFRLMSILPEKFSDYVFAWPAPYGQKNAFLEDVTGTVKA
ncbi:Retinol dehydrogenase 16 [Mactra antiquata]